MRETSGSIVSFVLLAAAGLIYFGPSIIAVVRGVRNVGSIIVVNTFLGWSLIGWVVALAWACSSSTARRGTTARRPQIGTRQAPPRPSSGGSPNFDFLKDR